MRRPRDFDAELKALNGKAMLLRERKLHQLGELVIATGADALDAEMPAGSMLATIGASDAGAKEAWRAKGAAFETFVTMEDETGVANGILWPGKFEIYRRPVMSASRKRSPSKVGLNGRR